MASARDIAGRLCQLKLLLPGLLWLVFVVVFAAVGAVVKTRSMLLTSALPAGVVATVAVWLAWTLLVERLAPPSSERPSYVAGDPRQWADFERAFWSYVDASSAAPPRAAE